MNITTKLQPMNNDAKYYNDMLHVQIIESAAKGNLTADKIAQDIGLNAQLIQGCIDRMRSEIHQRTPGPTRNARLYP